MKVLVGVDGSSNSFAAVEFIGRLISPQRDELVLLFAVPNVSIEEELDPDVEQRARSALAHAVLDAALARLPEPWRSRVERKESSGTASDALLDGVTEAGAELVVVGFRGTSTLWERFVLGSVSRAIVHTAPVPVLVVKPRLDDGPPATGQVAVQAKHLRALAAYDGPHIVEPMATLLSKFSWPEEAEGWVMTVVRPMFPFDVPDWVKNQPRDPDIAAMAAAWEQEHRQNVQSARQELAQFRAQLPPCFTQHDVLVMEGRPPEQIVAQLRAQGIDLAVLGSRGRGRVERLLVGSTTEQVLASSPCSVLIVR
jgi:nucleotide-binding universal stress UspA family protein